MAYDTRFAGGIWVNKYRYEKGIRRIQEYPIGETQGRIADEKEEHIIMSGWYFLVHQDVGD